MNGESNLSFIPWSVGDWQPANGHAALGPPDIRHTIWYGVYQARRDQAWKRFSRAMDSAIGGIIERQIGGALSKTSADRSPILTSSTVY